MIYNKNTAVLVAKELLKIKAVKLNSKTPFTWVSGIKSPIYCDNRKTLSFPELRNMLREEFAKIIKEKYSDVEVIAGVATGAIAMGVLVADILNMPFIYVRAAQKEHGLQNKIEGEVVEGKKVLVIEDLISTASSSINAVNALRGSGMKVVGMLAIYSYGLDIAIKNIEKAKCEVFTLTDYETTIKVAAEMDYVADNDMDTLLEWKKNPEKWGK